MRSTADEILHAEAAVHQAANGQKETLGAESPLSLKGQK